MPAENSGTKLRFRILVDTDTYREYDTGLYDI